MFYWRKDRYKDVVLGKSRVIHNVHNSQFKKQYFKDSVLLEDRA